MTCGLMFLFYVFILCFYVFYKKCCFLFVFYNFHLIFLKTFLFHIYFFFGGFDILDFIFSF